MKPKWGIIGCGGISRFHFAGLAKAGADIAYIADLDKAAAEPYLQQFGARFTTDYRELVADPEVTVVSVLTNSRFHREMCLAALAAGKDVVCEKTMTENAAEAAEIVRAVQSGDALFFTAFMKRFFPAVVKARALLPKLGRLFSAQIRTYQPWGNYYEMTAGEVPGWVFEKYGGAVMKCAASHLLDLTFNLLGRPKNLYAYVDYIPESNFDRKVTALFEYPEGLVANFEAAVHPLKRIGYERNAWDEHIQINGVNGRLDLSIVQWDFPEHNPTLLVHYDNETETSTEYRFPAVNPFDIEMAAFYEHLVRREAAHPDVVDGFNVDYVIEMMALSHLEKKPLALDWMGF
ncbi:MAG: Gfo/Idh/MocA family oxidoreductase [Anaerolineae bacterium]|nr:Gfo/Idh/MocA family oxidoreductase [Anaerolineae bacterium]